MTIVRPALLVAGLTAFGVADRPAGGPHFGQARVAVTGRVVVQQEASDRGVPGATVTLTMMDGRELTAKTTLEGTFRFDDVLPGDVFLSAETPVLVLQDAGADATGGPVGVRVPVPQDRELMLRMTRGAVTSGTVRDTSGRPLSGFLVTLLTWGCADGADPAARAVRSTVTNDLGEFRFFGLPSGDYVVVSQSRMTLGSGTAIGDSSENRGYRRVVFVPTFFPGTTAPERAVAVRVAAGEERAGVDIRMEPEPALTISGHLVLDDSRLLPTAQLHSMEPAAPPGILRSVIPDSDGRFSVTGLSSGAYRIVATRTDQLGAAVVRVDGEDVHGIRIEIGPGRSARGWAIGPGGRPIAGARITLRRKGKGPLVRSHDVREAVTGMDGRFEIRRLLPATYDVVVAAPPELAGNIWPARAVRGGQDVLDTGLSIDTEDVELDVVFEHRRPLLTGLILDVGDDVPIGSWVLAVPADQGLSELSARRVQASRVLADGTYSLCCLPPGRYAVGIVTRESPTRLKRRELIEKVQRDGSAFQGGEEPAIRLDLRPIR